MGVIDLSMYAGSMRVEAVPTGWHNCPQAGAMALALPLHAVRANTMFRAQVLGPSLLNDQISGR